MGHTSPCNSDLEVWVEVNRGFAGGRWGGPEQRLLTSSCVGTHAREAGSRCLAGFHPPALSSVAGTKPGGRC